MSKNRRLFLLPIVVVLLAIAVGYVWSGEPVPACTPAITTLSPEMNAIGAPDSGDVAMTFGSEMDPASYNDTTFIVHGRSSGPQSGAISGNATILSMAQDRPFAPGEVVTATATEGVLCADSGYLQHGYSWQFTTEVNPNSLGKFRLDSSYSLGNHPRSVFAADLDGDGDLDLATANRYSDDVSVLLNEGDGTFAPKVDYPAGDAPVAVLAADLDGDGDLDLTTACRGPDDVSFLLNEGDGTFAPKVRYPAGFNPTSIVVADLDGDGDLDLATANIYSDDVSVLLNKELGCCTGGTMGNVDCEGDVDIGDVTELIQLLFINVGDPFCCEDEADLDYNDEIDIGDLTILINRLFISVTDPPPCP